MEVPLFIITLMIFLFPTFHFNFHCDMIFQPVSKHCCMIISPTSSLKKLPFLKSPRIRGLCHGWSMQCICTGFHSLTQSLRVLAPEIIPCSDLSLKHSQWEISQAEQLSGQGSNGFYTFRAIVDCVNVRVMCSHYSLSVIKVLHVTLYVQVQASWMSSMCFIFNMNKKKDNLLKDINIINIIQ